MRAICKGARSMIAQGARSMVAIHGALLLPAEIPMWALLPSSKITMWAMLPPSLSEIAQGLVDVVPVANCKHKHYSRHYLSPLHTRPRCS